MELTELPSPQFVQNDAGMISVFLPAFEGEPDGAFFEKKDETTLHFVRAKGADILLTDIEPEVMDALKSAEKILVVETNVLKSIDLLEKALDAFAKKKDVDPEENEKKVMDAVERAYEAAVKF